MKPFNPLHLLAAGLATLLPTVLAATGGTSCNPTNTFCVSAIKFGSNATTTYDLTVTAGQVGWAALGFGRSMIGSPMVIMWRDTSNGNTVISQRLASDFATPAVVSAPPRVATANNYRALSSSTATTFSFSVPSTTDTRQTIIFAWSNAQPSSNSADASIQQHNEQGQLTLSLEDQLPGIVEPTATGASSTQPTPTAISGGDGGDSNNITTPLTPSQRAFAAHGVLLSLAFLVILPLGAIQARYLRTHVPGKWWFAAHWILQWPIAGLLIIIGFALAVAQINKLGIKHFSDTHMKWGMAIIVLYIFQCSLGGFIHFVKSARATMRPPQNYAHAVIGILIIALSFWQVYTGLDEEWRKIGGVHDVPKSVWTWWKVWMVMIPILYAVGLVFLPRQYKMEAQQRQDRTSPLRISAPKLQDRQERRYSYSA